MAKYTYQPQLPFEDFSSQGKSELSNISANLLNIQDIDCRLNHRDATLLFMTSVVTLTEKFEMPIVAPYKDDIPSNIVGLHRLNNTAFSNIAPHFYFDDNRNLQYWNNPFETEKKLARFKYSISLDFSMTQEMSRPQKCTHLFVTSFGVLGFNQEDIT